MTSGNSYGRAIYIRREVLRARRDHIEETGRSTGFLPQGHSTLLVPRFPNNSPRAVVHRRTAQQDPRAPRSTRRVTRQFLVQQRDGPAFFIRRPTDHKHDDVLRPDISLDLTPDSPTSATGRSRPLPKTDSSSLSADPSTTSPKSVRDAACVGCRHSPLPTVSNRRISPFRDPLSTPSVRSCPWKRNSRWRIDRLAGHPLPQS